jgi:hypothetical protein
VSASHHFGLATHCVSAVDRALRVVLCDQSLVYLAVAVHRRGNVAG